MRLAHPSNANLAVEEAEVDGALAVEEAEAEVAVIVAAEAAEGGTKTSSETFR